MEMATMLHSESNRESKRAKKLEHDHQDLISSLPVHMLQHILCSMPTIDAVRSSTLSRSWLHAWNSLPVFTLNFACHTQLFEDTFPLVAQFYNTISILTMKETMPVSFHVSWPSFRNDFYMNCIDAWMRLVSRHRVRELEIDLLPEEEEKEEESEKEEEDDEDETGRTMESYNLPHDTLFSAAESLVALKLTACSMPLQQSLQIESRNLVSLRVLFWKDDLINHKVVKELLRLCPVLEECTLISVSKRFPSILLSNHRKIKHVKLDGFMDITLEQYLPNLQVLDVSNFGSIECGNYRKSCNGLRKLSLKTCWYTNYGNLQYFICNLPSLESLVLNTDGTWPVTISNSSIENFSFSSSMEPQKIEVHAPRLRCYEYRSSVLPPTSFETKPFALKRFDLVLTPHMYDETDFFFICLRSNLLKLAAYNSALKLTINAKKFSPDKLPPDKGQSPAFVDFVELQDIYSSLIHNMTLIKWLFWCSRPLRLSTRPSYIFLQAFRDIIMDDAKLCGDCCTCSCSCLRGVKVQTRCGIKDFKDIKIDEKCELLSEDVLRFRLQWI